MKKISCIEKKFKFKELKVTDKVKGELSVSSFGDLIDIFQENQECEVDIKCEEEGNVIKGRVWITKIESGE